MGLSIVKYNETFEDRWDAFVMSESINGTFMHTRKFLNYHPVGRFKDDSILFINSGNIIAVMPACEVIDEGKRTFFSHRGSTFGGIAIRKESYNVSDVEDIFRCLNEYLIAEKYERAFIRSTSALFSKRDMSLLDYEFYKNGYDQYDELSFYVDCRSLPEDITKVMSTSRRRDLRYSFKNGLRFELLSEKSQIETFYHILETNLKKFDAKPVHSLEELLDLKYNRFPDITEFYGVYLGEEMIAGSMVFKYSDKVFHTQYLAALPQYQKMFPMNFLDHNLILTARNQGFDSFSFGISTEERGKVLNVGLSLFKEGFGCDYSINRLYVKNL